MLNNLLYPCLLYKRVRKREATATIIAAAAALPL